MRLSTTLVSLATTLVLNAQVYAQGAIFNLEDLENLQNRKSALSKNDVKSDDSLDEIKTLMPTLDSFKTEAMLDSFKTEAMLDVENLF